MLRSTDHRDHCDNASSSACCNHTHQVSPCCNPVPITQARRRERRNVGQPLVTAVKPLAWVLLQNQRFEESVERAAREGKNAGHALAVVARAGDLTLEEEEALRARVNDMEATLKREKATEMAIEEKIKARQQPTARRMLSARLDLVCHDALTG